MNKAARREREIAEKFQPFNARCEELVARAHAAGVPDTKFLPRKGIDTHWFNHREGGLVEIDDRYVPTEQLLQGRLSELFMDISGTMQLKEAGSRSWSRRLPLYIKQLKLWSAELERAGAPDADLRFLGTLLARLVIAGANR